MELSVRPSTNLYKPLDVAEEEIRLVKIPRSQDAGIVECSLLTVTLQKIPSYKCLSYAWGDPKITKPILLENQITLVTHNLEAAIRNLRQHACDWFTWIDAVSINQNDSGKEITRSL